MRLVINALLLALVKAPVLTALHGSKTRKLITKGMEKLNILATLRFLTGHQLSITKILSIFTRSLLKNQRASLNKKPTHTRAKIRLHQILNIEER